MIAFISALILVIFGLLWQAGTSALVEGMPAQAVITVSGVVVALTSFVKWAGLPDRQGPLAVISLSFLGTLLWAYSRGNYSRALLFDFFAGWVAVLLSAAGVFGFTRAMPEAVSSFATPSRGSAAEPTTKPPL